jgi:hypothetical protein
VALPTSSLHPRLGRRPAGLAEHISVPTITNFDPPFLHPPQQTTPTHRQPHLRPCYPVTEVDKWQQQPELQQHRQQILSSAGEPRPTAVPPNGDPEAYHRHIQQFLDEYAPATPPETQLVHEIADTAWRLNRIPLLEAALLSPSPNPQTPIPQLAQLESRQHVKKETGPADVSMGPAPGIGD